MGESCATCRFSATPLERAEGVLECHRTPPVVTGRHPLADWPLVPGGAWCGEFEARPATKPVRKQRPAVGDTEVREQG
jgi:hypothetical protein